MDDKIEIIICLGSSCFSRGNRTILKTISNYIEVNNLSDKVFFHGARCFGHCEHGPALKINNKEFKNISEENVSDILKTHIK